MDSVIPRIAAALERIADELKKANEPKCMVTITPDKHLRNCDRYVDLEAAKDGFMQYCCKRHCGDCQFNGLLTECFPRWLLAPAEGKEADA